MTSSSSWRCPKVFSLKPGEQQFERFADFFVITKTALLPLLSALLRRAYHLLSGKPPCFSASRAKRGEPFRLLLDAHVQFTGLRLGEKLYEELLIDPEHALPTVHPRIFRSQEPCPKSAVLEVELDLLEKAIAEQDLEEALAAIRRLVPEYGPLDQSQLLQEKPTSNPSQRLPLMN